MAAPLVRLLVSNSQTIIKQSANRLLCDGVRHERSSLPVLSTIHCRDYSSFVKGTSGEGLWDALTGLSNPGRKRGRGKNAKRRQDLNRGQQLGKGKSGMIFPGLTGPALVGSRKVIQISKAAPTEEKEPATKPFRPKRTKIFPLQRGYTGRRYPGTSIGAPDPIYDYTFENFDTKVLEYKVVSHMTGNLGRQMRLSSLVVTGNKNGLAGYAVGKAPLGQASIRKAKNMAAQRLQYIELYNKHTVFHNFAVREGHTTVSVQKMPKGYGLECHRVIKTICELIGIQDLHVKVEGRASNIQNMVKAFFRGLMEQETHQQLADRLQLHVVEYRKELNNVPIPVASPSQGHTRQEPYSEEAFDFDNMYYKDGKIPLEKVNDPMAYHKQSEGTWKHFLRTHRDRNQIQARYLRNIYGLEVSPEELKQRNRPLK